MYPILFQYKGLTISTYGLMLMLAFLVCNYLLKNYKFTKKKKENIFVIPRGVDLKKLN